MEDPQDGSLLCERCGQLDSRLMLSSTQSSPYRPWLAADVVTSAAATGCIFCCMLVDLLGLVGVEQDRDDRLLDRALSRVQEMKTKSKTVARFLAPKAESMQRKRDQKQRERDGWITFFVPEEVCGRDSIPCINVTVTGPELRKRYTWMLTVAPGPGIQQSPTMSGSELPYLCPFRGAPLQSTSQSVTHLSAAIREWRRYCQDTHECWKPLSQRRNRAVEYMKLHGGEIIRRDWFDKDETRLMPAWSDRVELPPLELEHGRLDSVVMPSRCLEIVPGGDDGQCRFWLRETVGELGRYVILSHRWGPDTERVRTLKGNYGVRVGGGSDDAPPIEPGDVTKVFQEAAQLTAGLGIKYIWIDSLCIVQDDADDWKREATKMASYYENAWLMIAASSTEGLFFPADPRVLPAVVHLPYTDDAGLHAAGLSIQPRFSPHLQDLYKKTITDSQLLSRGWVLQEWLLSPRIAAFSQSAGPFLVCSEDLPRSAVTLNFVSMEEPEATEKSYKTALDLSLLVRCDIAKSWRRVVEVYSGLKLTNVASDRLVAMAGVASEFDAAFRGALDSRGSVSYLCGLWLEDFARGLQWEPVDRSSRPFARVPGFPSWTWASLGRIKADEDGTGTSEIEPAAVRWHTQWRRQTEIVFTLTEVRNVSVAADQNGGQPRPEEARTIQRSSTTSDFGIENGFLALRIAGQLIKGFYIQKGWPGGYDNPYHAARITANHLIGTDTAEATISDGKPSEAELYVDETWYRVTKPDNKLIGWASFDDTNLHVENTDSGPYIAGNRQRRIYAFRLSCARNVPVLYWDNKVNINAVLFVAEIETLSADERCFERVGVGRMMEASIFTPISDIFREDDDFWLV